MDPSGIKNADEVMEWIRRIRAGLAIPNWSSVAAIIWEA
jgi:hypothetical protein